MAARPSTGDAAARALCWMVIASGLGLQAVAAEPGEHHRQLEESLRKSDAARSIQPRYLDLASPPRTAAQAIEILLIQGFRCGVRVADDYLIFNEDLMLIQCTQDESRIDPECPTVILTLNAEWSRVVATRAELLDQLGSTIKSVSADCPVPVVGAAAEFAAQRESAEKSLEQQRNRLELVGATGKQAFDRLVANGLDCGIEPLEQSGSGLDATLVCRRLPSRIQGCWDAEVLLRIRWEHPHRTPIERVRGLELATVQSVMSQCRLPRPE
jgi:hypothetical protein